MDVNWIKAQLTKSGMTQAELAAHAGMTQAQFSKSMKGRRQWKAEEADSIRRALGYFLPEDLSDDDPKARIIRRLNDLGEDQQRSLVLFLESLVAH